MGWTVPQYSVVGGGLISPQYDVHGVRGVEGCENNEELEVCSFYKIDLMTRRGGYE